MDVTYTKPLLPLRDIVIFPSIVVPLFVGREKSIKALQEAMKTDKSIILVAQKNSETDDPSDKDLPEHYRGIGIRIEDDVLVTRTGNEVLTGEVPKTIKDIESFMAGRRS